MMRLARWLRRLAVRPSYRPEADPVVRQLRTIRTESLAATRASRKAMREANRVELAYLHDRIKEGPR